MIDGMNKEQEVKTLEYFSGIIDKERIEKTHFVKIELEERRKNRKKFTNLVTHIQDKTRAKDTLKFFIHNKVKIVKNIKVQFVSQAYTNPIF